MRQDQLERVYVLHSRPYRDTSLLVELFSRERGRISAVVRGARGGKRSRTALLQPFIALQVALRGRSELKTLASVDSVAGTAAVPTGERLLCGFYLNELLWTLLHRDDPHEQLFDAYAEALEALAGPTDIEPVLRRFELALLRESGYAPAYHQDAAGHPIDAGLHYTLDPEFGFRVATTDDQQRSFSGALLLALEAAQPVAPALLSQLKALTRQQIDHLLHGRALRSRDLMRRYRSSGRPAMPITARETG